MSAHPLPDLQTLAALAIGVLAAMHLLKRWWPHWASLWGKGALGTPSASACGAGSTPTGPGAGCSAGCGQCGSASAPASKVHRVRIVRGTRP